jgi:hypothetical protein
MRKARVHAGLRGAALRHWVISVTDVDYCEMSSKNSRKLCTDFSWSSSSASGITLKLLRGLINTSSPEF